MEEKADTRKCMENSLHMNRISICRIRNGSRSDSNVLRSFRLYFDPVILDRQ